MRIAKITLCGFTYEDVEVRFEEYAAGGMAILLGEEYDPIATATVYMDGVPPSEGCVWIKDWSENAGMLLSLTKAGLIQPTGRTTRAGYALAHEARVFNPKED